MFPETHHRQHVLDENSKRSMLWLLGTGLQRFTCSQGEPESIAGIELQNIHRIYHIAQRFAHLPPLLVTHLGVVSAESAAPLPATLRCLTHSYSMQSEPLNPTNSAVEKHSRLWSSGGISAVAVMHTRWR